MKGRGAEKFAGRALASLTTGSGSGSHPLQKGDFPARVYISDILLDFITRNPNQPREIFDEDALNELAASIKEKGVLQPIVVREIEEGKKYEIVLGERRWRACKIAGLTRIPAIIKHSGNKQEQLLIGLIENIQRENLTPGEEAATIGKLLADGLTQTEIHQATGKGLPHLSRCAKISRFLETYKKKHGTIDIRMKNGKHASLEGLLQAASADSYEEGERILRTIMTENLTSPAARNLRNKDRVKSRAIPAPLPAWLKRVRKTLSAPYQRSFTESAIKKGAARELDDTITALSSLLEELNSIKTTFGGK